MPTSAENNAPDLHSALSRSRKHKNEDLKIPAVASDTIMNE